MLLLCDGFDSYTQTSDLLLGKKWQSVSGWTWSATAGRNGGGGLLMPNTTGTIQAMTGSIGSSNPVCMGLWFKATAAPAASTQFVRFRRTGDFVYLGGIGISSTGVILAQNTGGATTGTGTINVCDNQWHWIEFYYDGNSSSSSPCYVDSILQWTVAGVNNSPVDWFEFNISSAMTANLSWPLLWNSAAGNPTVAGFPYGPKTITTTRPISDGTCTFGTVSSGTAHWDMVNDTIQDGDATYVEGLSGTGLQDLYNYSALGGGIPTILTVMVNTMLENPAGGTANYQIACKSGAAAVSLKTSAVVPASYNKMDLWAISTDPNTSAAWTATGLNAAQFGVKAV